MRDQVMACFGGCVEETSPFHSTAEEHKEARLRDKQLTKMLSKYHKDEMKRLKLLMLGTGESGKSTITKQMRIIHINGFDNRERMSKIVDIKRNVRDSILAILMAMPQLDISLHDDENQKSVDLLLEEAQDADRPVSSDFLTHTEILWKDKGIQESYSRCNEYQLLDCAKYFLDKVNEIRNPDYLPSDQDILRCRVITTCVQHIDFSVNDSGQQVQFSVYDVGGQRGERKKWIQMFDSVVANVFVADVSSFDLTLREDPEKNRLLEALEIFEQVWNNRFLRHVSCLLFLNKIDILAEKVSRNHTPLELTRKYPHVFPDYEKFEPTPNERLDFINSFPGNDEVPKKRNKKTSRTDVDPGTIKAAVYIRNIFMRIVTGDLRLRQCLQDQDPDWHQFHTCQYYYTCAVDTQNITKVLEGCRSLIIRKHLERFGII
ncbi:guanine nucleotide-binding protein G(s) subunit alpha-like [Haliotis rubra]|uniref:guanine nucleotide-binding protein G(s) subunit alpha-like n=1 Tax=Haliotis rubra TaxID=36100 RepID=UPI001EE5579B|nr:guanine nucleotide-binding protein G(s) subunit alpha-like [Haliotis rubra]XP_046565108.1 guanine nucleotide-binding protein G(s) subunit alpha-like [Haliotis rubra]XP_046565109.1 guanine nucleotide-binding protein G(s) subunit alpha-like [Haliotis rubra]